MAAIQAGTGGPRRSLTIVTNDEKLVDDLAKSAEAVEFAIQGHTNPFSCDLIPPGAQVKRSHQDSHTEPGVHETGMLQVLVFNTNTRPALAHCTMPQGHGQVHTCAMQVCELTAVALLPPRRSLRRAQASTSPRLA